MKNEIRTKYLHEILVQETSYLNNIKHGEEKLRYSNGKIAIKRNYKNGSQHGIYKFFNEFQALENIFYFNNNRHHGIRIIFQYK
jgi:antitoxin component YwqK of YwqJK toxin-antitoxin module